MAIALGITKNKGNWERDDENLTEGETLQQVSGNNNKLSYGERQDIAHSSILYFAENFEHIREKIESETGKTSETRWKAYLSVIVKDKLLKHQISKSNTLPVDIHDLPVFDHPEFVSVDKHLGEIESMLTLSRVLGPELLEIASFRLKGFTQEEISEMVGVSRRTIIRKLKKVKEVLSNHYNTGEYEKGGTHAYAQIVQ